MFKTFNRLGVLLGLFITGHYALADVDRVGDFNLIDHTGTAHQLSKYGYQNALVLISHSSSCSLNQKDFTQYKIMETHYAPLKVSFVLLNSAHEDDIDTIRRTHRSYDVGLPVLNDDAQLVAESLNISKAGEIVVIDPESRAVLYRGPMDQASSAREGTTGTSYLADAIRAAHSGERAQETVVVDFDAPADCQLKFPIKEEHLASTPDYETEVAPIFIERCVSCHIDGGIAPFAMNSHQVVQGWSPMIREVLMVKRMPPMQTDPSIGHFTNAGNIPIDELQTLVHWIDAGSPRE